MGSPKVYIVILNYNNFLDTIECLESVFNLRYMNFTVIVCDNGSKDRSLEFIQKWAQGSYFSESSFVRTVTPNNKTVPKPIHYFFLDIDQIVNDDFHDHYHPRLILLDNKGNLGFGAGNNAGIRWALKDSDLEYIWILNNDTVVDPDSLMHLVNKMSSEPQLGSCGSTVLYFHDPETLQALGGFSYTPWTGKSRQLGHLQKWASHTPGNCLEKEIEERMFWIQGASIFVKKEFLDKMGLIPEDYFLYFEEQDWGVRSRRIFQVGYASNSIVYHKEGRTTGSASFGRRRKSLISEFYLSHGRLLFTQKYYPRFLPLIYISHLYLAVYRLLHRQWRNALVVLLSSMFYEKEQDKKKREGNPYDHFIQRLRASRLLWWMTANLEKESKK